MIDLRRIEPIKKSSNLASKASFATTSALCNGVLSMANPLTIDNLPRQVDENYAYQQREFDKLVQAGQISAGGALETFAAAQAGALADIGKPSAVAALIGTNVKTTVAFVDFDPSVKGVRSRSSFLTPALGPIPKREQDRQKILDLIEKASPGDRAEIEKAGAAVAGSIEESIRWDKLAEEIRSLMASLRQA
jgi:hypothetical protein